MSVDTTPDPRTIVVPARPAPAPQQSPATPRPQPGPAPTPSPVESAPDERDAGWCLSGSAHGLLGGSAVYCPWAPGRKFRFSPGVGIDLNGGVEYLPESLDDPPQQRFDGSLKYGYGSAGVGGSKPQFGPGGWVGSFGAGVGWKGLVEAGPEFLFGDGPVTPAGGVRTGRDVQSRVKRGRRGGFKLGWGLHYDVDELPSPSDSACPATDEPCPYDPDRVYFVPLP